MLTILLLILGLTGCRYRCNQVVVRCVSRAESQLFLWWIVSSLWMLIRSLDC